MQIEEDPKQEPERSGEGSETCYTLYFQVTIIVDGHFYLLGHSLDYEIPNIRAVSATLHITNNEHLKKGTFYKITEKTVRQKKKGG